MSVERLGKLRTQMARGRRSSVFTFLDFGEPVEVDARDVELLDEVLLLRDPTGDVDDTLPTGDGDLLLDADFVFLISASVVLVL